MTSHIEITHIIHISDIHIQLYKRHTEYITIFDKLYIEIASIKNKLNITSNRDIPLITVITGDLLHSKSDLSPECISIAYNFLKSLASLTPTFIIPGNHDVNMNNKERMDSITPIIYDLHEHYPIYYLLRSQQFQYANIIFYHASIFDYHIIEPSILKSSYICKNLRKIILFHGKINGVELFHGSKLEHGETDIITNKTITPTSFNGYDIALLGDIHKMQFIKDNIAYAGSLIQQNHGESIDSHGYILWNIENCTGVHHHITNESGYITLNMKNNIPEHICFDMNGEHLDKCYLPKNLRLRITHDGQGNESSRLDYIKALKMHHTIHEYCFINNAVAKDNLLITNQNNSTETSDIYRIIDTNIQSIYINEFLKSKTNLTDEEQKQICEINIEYNKKINIDICKNTGIFQIQKLTFSNLFCYGTNNIIDFTKLNGIVGIIAENHMGKSSILDILLYAIYDKITRKGTVKDIINNRKNNFLLKLDIKFNNWIYTIIKNGIRGKKETTINITVKFYRTSIINDIVEALEQDTGLLTKQLIAETFGNFDDIINTCFSIQNNSCTFIDSENTARKLELERILRLDFLNELTNLVSKDILVAKGIFEHLGAKLHPDIIMKDKERLEQTDEKIILMQNQEKPLLHELELLQKQNIELQKKDSGDANKIHTMINKLNLNYGYNFEFNDNGLSGLAKEITFINNKILTLQIPNINDNCEYISLNIKDIDIIIKSKTADITEQISKWNDKIIKLDKIIEDKIRKCHKYTKYSGNTNFNELKQSYTNQLEHKSKILSILQILKTQITNGINNHLILKNKLCDKLTLLGKFSLDTIIVNELKKLVKLKSSDDISILDVNYCKYRDKWYSMLIKMDIDTKDDINKYKSLKTYQKYMMAIKCKMNNDFITEKIEPLLLHHDGCNNDNNDNNDNNNDNNDNNDNNNDNNDNNDNSCNIGIKLEDHRIILTEIKNLKSEIDNISTFAKIWNTLDTSSINNLDINICSENDLKLYIGKFDTEIRKLNDTIHLLDMESNFQYENEKIEIDILEAKDIKHKYIAKIEKTNNSEYTEINKLISVKQYILDKRDYDLMIKQLTEQKNDISNIVVYWKNKYSDIKENIEKEFNKMQYEQNIENIKKKLEIIKIDLIKLQSDKSNLMSLMQQYKRNHLECKEIEQKKKMLEYYKAAIKQIPFLLFQKISPLFESRINEFLSILTDFTIKVEISESKIDMYLCRINGNNDIGYNKNILINNASGYERFISSLAIRLALLEINNLPRINFLAIDEGWSSFDNHNIQNINVIMDYLSRKFDFILTMSHMTSIKECCDTQILLKRTDDGYSNVIY